MTQALHTLLEAAVGRDASDLHLSPGEMPWLRIMGEMEALPLQTGPLAGEQIRGMMEEVMGEEGRGRWTAVGARSVNFAYAATGIGRFRINVATTLTGTAAVIRHIRAEIPPAEKLGLPDALVEMADLPAGLVFVTGAAGEGKSTTLAALLDRINRSRSGHILTIEDPIEFVHAPQRCRISQREVGIHTESFTRALEDALRQDPDVIVVGEVRSEEQLLLILQAAETGHLVMGTAHTINAVSTITRLVGMVETARQGQVRAQLAMALRGIATQRLVPTVDGRRLAAFEILVNSPAVSANIESGATVEIKSAIEMRRDGMRTLEQSLAELVDAGHITHDAAREHANDRKALERHLGSPAVVEAASRLIVRS
jgi:twitching motility protein PilT